MGEPPVLVIILIVVLANLVLGFMYLGGTVLILVSSWVPLKTRLRWVAFSVMPLALLVVLAAIAAAFSKITTASGAGDNFGDAFAPIGLIAGLAVVGALAANWLVFKRFRASFPRVNA
jgi:uncharacterized membrane protein YcjF (UPF0283 family)